MLAVREILAVVSGLVMLEIVKASRLLEVMLYGTDGKLVRVSVLRFSVRVNELKVVEEIWQLRS
jgi:hypothetical protein